MVHESFPPATSYASESHPRHVFSISYLLTGFFHSSNSLCSTIITVAITITTIVTMAITEVINGK